MSYSGQPSPLKRRPSAAAASALLAHNINDKHHGFASHVGSFFVQQLRMRFCLPAYVASVLELAARVSNFSATRDALADLLVAAVSLCGHNTSDSKMSGSKFLDNLRKHACIIARELCLDLVSNSAMQLVNHEEMTSDVLDKVVISTAALMSLESSDQNANINSALENGVKRACVLISKRTKSIAHKGVLSDASASSGNSHPVDESGARVVDMLSKQAQIDLRSSLSLCQLISALLVKQRSFDSMLESFTAEALDSSWYSSLALNEISKNKLFQSQRVVSRCRVPFKLIVGLVKLLAQRCRKMTSMSFDDCTTELWQFVTLFFPLRDELKNLQGFDMKLLDGISDIFEEITCSASPLSWLSRFAVVQELKLQEAIVADELHSLVEVSYHGSRVYLWMTDCIATLSIIAVPQSDAVSSELRSLMILCHKRFWQELLVFVGKALIEILKLCRKELEASLSNDSASDTLSLSNAVRGIGGVINAGIDLFDPTKKDGEARKGFFGSIKQTAYDTARAVRQGKGIISAAAVVTKGTVKTAFSAVATTANVVVQAGALVASGVDAAVAASGVAGAVAGAAKAVGIGHARAAKEMNFATMTSSIFFTVSLIRAIEEAIKCGVVSSNLMISECRGAHNSEEVDIESTVHINFQKQHIEPLCIEVCSAVSDFFESAFRELADEALDGKHDGHAWWESGVVKGVNAIIVNVPDANPFPALNLAAQDLFRSYAQIIFDQFCLAVARCKRTAAARINELSAMESLQEIALKLVQTLNNFSQNDFDGCASNIVTSFRERLTDILKMQFVLSKDELLKMLQQMQANAGNEATGNQYSDLPTVLEHRFSDDANILSFLESLKHRKWRSAFDIPESDIFCYSAEVFIQFKSGSKDRANGIKGILYITHDHICFLEDSDFAKDRGRDRKQSAIDLGPVAVPASGGRLRIKWVRSNRISIMPEDRSKIIVKGPLDAALYQNACFVSQFRISHPEINSNTYIKCSFAQQT
jgi:hypothetical protein